VVGQSNEHLHRLGLDADRLSIPLENETSGPDGPAVERKVLWQGAPPGRL
jgi:hypothetical protein